MDAFLDLTLQGQSSGSLQLSVTPVATLQYETGNIVPLQIGEYYDLGEPVSMHLYNQVYIVFNKTLTARHAVFAV